MTERRGCERTDAGYPSVHAGGRTRADRFRPRGVDVVGHDATVLWDPRVQAWVLHHRTGWLTGFMKVVTWLGSTAVIVPLAFAVGRSSSSGAWAGARRRCCGR